MADAADKDDVVKLVDAILEKGQRPKQADVLIRLAKSAILFHTTAPNGDAYADIVIRGHRETHRVRGAGFRQWLRHQYFKETGGGVQFRGTASGDRDDRRQGSIRGRGVRRSRSDR
jgi:hypothetical protein